MNGQVGDGRAVEARSKDEEEVGGRKAWGEKWLAVAKEERGVRGMKEAAGMSSSPFLRTARLVEYPQVWDITDILLYSIQGIIVV